ncbi:reverse transcriptase [Gossypium australe]|uniref:Reverse transcriptase n=1 Tax=Gossypium australe TaxID=47621 RepID=A0A5B6WJE6_9ROSI|nr:reverse transcriptase [Gossypium australe]
MAPLKELGIDRFPTLFYQKYWHVIGNDIARFCLDMLNSRNDIEVINRTNIMLILKINSPRNTGQFRPISLCNVIYKIISKVLVNRFKRVLDLCIDDNQVAFVQGRQINDNILVAYEILHSFKKKREGSVRPFALKFNMSKAYNRMLCRLGFCNDWITLAKRYITFVSYSVVLNGIQRGEIRPTRSLRQGDPLNPYLFIICAKGFSTLINMAKCEGLIGGAKKTHLFFVDDNILFGEATTEWENAMKLVVAEYEQVLGQLVNFEKSLIYFSSNVGVDKRE